MDHPTVMQSIHHELSYCAPYTGNEEYQIFTLKNDFKYAERTQNRISMAEICIQLGKCLIWINQEEAIEQFSTGLYLASECNQFDMAGVAIDFLAKLCTIAGNFAASIDYYQRYLKIRSFIRSPMSISQIHCRLAELYSIAGRCGDALQYIDQESAHKRSKCWNNETNVTLLERSEPNNYAKICNISEYDQYHCPLSESIDASIGRTLALSEIAYASPNPGTSYMSDNQQVVTIDLSQSTAGGSSYASNASVVASSEDQKIYYIPDEIYKGIIDDLKDIWQEQNKRAIILYVNGDDAESRQIFDLNLKLTSEVLFDKGAQFETMINIAMCCRMAGDYTEAIGLTKKSLKLSQELNDQSLIAIGLYYLSEIINEFAYELLAQSGGIVTGNIRGLTKEAQKYVSARKKIIENWYEELVLPKCMVKLEDAKIVYEEILNTTGNKSLKIYRSHMALADIYSCAGYHQNAISSLNKAFQATDSAIKIEMKPFIIYKISENYISCYDYTSAIGELSNYLFNKLMSTIRIHLGGIGRAYKALISAYDAINDYGAALNCVNQQYSFLIRIGDEREATLAKQNILYYSIILEQIKQIEDLKENDSEVDISATDLWRTRHFIGVRYYGLRDYQNAIKCHEINLAFVRDKLGYGQELLETEKYLGICLKEIEDYDGAINCFKDILFIAENGKDIQMTITALYFLYEIYFKKSVKLQEKSNQNYSPSEANSAIQHGLHYCCERIKLKLTDPSSITISREEMKQYHNVDRYHDAIQIYQNIIETAKAANSKLLQFSVQLIIGRTYFRLKKWHPALQHYNRANIIALQMKQVKTRYQIVHRMYEILVQLKEYNLAQRKLELCIDILENAHNDHELQKIYLSGVEFNEEIGQLDKALNYAEKYQILCDKLDLKSDNIIARNKIVKIEKRLNELKSTINYCNATNSKENAEKVPNGTTIQEISLQEKRNFDAPGPSSSKD